MGKGCCRPRADRFNRKQRLSIFHRRSAIRHHAVVFGRCAGGFPVDGQLVHRRVGRGFRLPGKSSRLRGCSLHGLSMSENGSPLTSGAVSAGRVASSRTVHWTRGISTITMRTCSGAFWASSGKTALRRSGVLSPMWVWAYYTTRATDKNSSPYPTAYRAVIGLPDGWLPPWSLADAPHSGNLTDMGRLANGVTGS